MSRTKYFFCLSLLTSSASLLIASNHPIALVKPAIPRPAPTTNQSRPLSIPLTFEANVGQASPEVAFLARGPHLSTFLTRTGIEVEPRGPRQPTISRRITAFKSPSRGLPEAPTTKPPITRMPPSHGRELPRFAPKPITSSEVIPRSGAQPFPITRRAEARRILPGVDLVAYSNAAADRRENQLEFDLRIAPQANARQLTHQDLWRRRNAPQR